MPNEPAPRTLTEQQAWVGAVCEVCGWQPAMMAGRAAKLVKSIRAAGGTLADLEQHYSQSDSNSAWWWYRDDWRGKRGQRPSQAGINETWGAWELPIAIQWTERQNANHEKRSEPSGDPSGELSQAQLIARRLSGD